MCLDCLEHTHTEKIKRKNGKNKNR